MKVFSSISGSGRDEDDEVGLSGGVGGEGRSLDEHELARALDVVVVGAGGGWERRLS